MSKYLDIVREHHARLSGPSRLAHVNAWRGGVHAGYAGAAWHHMFDGWVAYAESHTQRYKSGIWEDCVLGDEWERIGKALLALLNGEMGPFDCGTLDGTVRDILKSEGFSGE